MSGEGRHPRFPHGSGVLLGVAVGSVFYYLLWRLHPIVTAWFGN